MIKVATVTKSIHSFDLRKKFNFGSVIWSDIIVPSSNLTFCLFKTALKYTIFPRN